MKKLNISSNRSSAGKKTTDRMPDFELYKAIAQSLRKGIIIVDNQDTILFVNRQLSELVGYEENYLVGKKASGILLGKKVAGLMKSKIRNRKKGVSEEYEISVRTKSGDEIELNIYAAPLYDKEGKIWGSIGFHNDISRIKKYQVELEETLNQRNKLISNIREAFFSIDIINRKHILLSEAHEDVYGYSIADFHKNPNLWFDVIHPDDKALVREGMARLAKGEITSDEHRIIRKDGSIIWVEGKVTPTLNESGELIRLDGVVANISKRKEAERRLQEKISDLNTFIYKASHDLGAPLATMLGLINLSDIRNNDPEVSQYLNLLRASLDKMNILLKDLVSSVSITEDKLIVESVDFKAMIEHIHQSQKFAPEFKNMQFTADVKDPILIQTDRRFIYPILSNLIMNAVKYRNSENNSFIHVSVQESTNGIIMEVADNGIGIPEKLHDKVFDMFYRGTQISTGSGLGLYIVKTAVQKLGGKIEMKSREKIGTTFAVHLPALKSQLSENLVRAH
jgi:PAS domain S-box-containing protein